MVRKLQHFLSPHISIIQYATLGGCLIGFFLTVLIQKFKKKLPLMEQPNCNEQNSTEQK